MLYPKKVKQLKNFAFVIIDDNENSALKTKAIAESFQNMHCLAVANNYDDGLDIVLEHNPDIVFLEIDPQDKESKLSLALINEFHRYLTVVPRVLVTTSNDALCLDSFRYGVFDYFIKPLESKDLRKSLFRLDKELSIINFNSNNNFSHFLSEKTISNSNISIESIEHGIDTENTLIAEEINDESVIEPISEVEKALETVADIEHVQPIDEQQDEVNNDNISKEVAFIPSENSKLQPLVICVKSYGDYRYIDAEDICYLQADNNSTDIHLNTGEMITAFKTLKHFEGVLTYPFVRIHNSYIVNTQYVSRIHTGNAVCHIKNTTTKLPFSKSYKENIDAIITTIASGNYLEI